MFSSLYQCDSMAGMHGEIPGYVIVSRPKTATPCIVMAAPGQPKPEEYLSDVDDGIYAPLTAGPSTLLCGGETSWTWGAFKQAHPDLAACCIPWGFGANDPSTADVSPNDVGFYQEPVDAG